MILFFRFFKAWYENFYFFNEGQVKHFNRWPTTSTIVENLNWKNWEKMKMMKISVIEIVILQMENQRIYSTGEACCATASKALLTKIVKANYFLFQLNSLVHWGHQTIMDIKYLVLKYRRVTKLLYSDVVFPQGKLTETSTIVTSNATFLRFPEIYLQIGRNPEVTIIVWEMIWHKRDVMSNCESTAYSALDMSRILSFSIPFSDNSTCSSTKTTEIS